MENIVEHKELSIDLAMKKIDAIDNEIKFTAFGKTRNNKNKVKYTGKASNKNEMQEKMDIDLLKRQSNKIEEKNYQDKITEVKKGGDYFQNEGSHHRTK